MTNDGSCSHRQRGLYVYSIDENKPARGQSYQIIKSIYGVPISLSIYLSTYLSKSQPPSDYTNPHLLYVCMYVCIYMYNTPHNETTPPPLSETTSNYF